MAYTDFDDLANLTTDKTPESALPCNLADDVLQLISNDLKQVALCRSKTVDQYPRRVRTLHLLSRLMLAQSERITGDEPFGHGIERADLHALRKLLLGSISLATSSARLMSLSTVCRSWPKA